MISDNFVQILIFLLTVCLGTANGKVHRIRHHRTYEFCANNQIFSFSDSVCPGGVLLKEPLELTEPCHCINQRLTVYEQCSPGQNYPSKICHRAGASDGISRRHKLVKLIQPAKASWKFNISHSHRNLALSSKCRHVRSRCTKRLPNSILLSSHWNRTVEKEVEGDEPELLKYWKRSSMENYQSKPRVRHRHHRQKREMSLFNVEDPRLQARIKETMNFLNELQFGSNVEKEAGIKPKSMSLKMLVKTIRIFSRITPNVIVNDDTFITILTLFLEKYADLELPGISGNLAVDDFLDKRTFDEVMAKLEECLSKASDPSQEFEFTQQNPDECPAQISHFVHKVQTESYGVKLARQELGTTMPADRKYIPEVEDFLLGSLWKAFDAVYPYCFSYLFTFNSAQIFVNYYNIMDNIFSHPLVVKDFLSPDGQGTFMYASRIDHENLTVLMKNLDGMDEAAHFGSKFKQYFLKPKSPAIVRVNAPEYSNDTTATGQPSSNSTQARSSSSSSPGKPAPSSSSPKEAPKSKSSRPKRRPKRSPTSVNLDWSSLEIWEGRGYCLQLANPRLPPSISNTYPNIENLCAE